MATKLNEGIWVGDNDDAHRIQEIIAAKVTLDFGSGAAAGGLFATATGVMAGARTGMMFFMGGYDDSAAAQVTASACIPVSIKCTTADTIIVSAANFAAGAVDMGSAQYPVLGIRKS